MATIKDVAKKAGVAISTASYALNNDPRVSDETRKKVLDVAKELNYFPNAAARNLKRQKTNTVGVFLDGFAGPIYTNILDGIHIELSQNNFNIIVTSGESGKRMLLQRQVDGGIVMDQNLSNELLMLAAKKGTPLILLDRQLKGKNIYTSLVDNETVVYELINSMINKGYKRFGFLSGPNTSYDNNSRLRGFQRALDEHQLTPEVIYHGEFTKRSGYLIGKELLEQSTQLPDMIYSSNDEMAIGLMDALKEGGIKIPDDIAIAGFDDIELASYYSPQLTTVNVDRFAWGKALAQAIIKLLENEQTNIDIDINYKIVYRSSC